MNVDELMSPAPTVIEVKNLGKIYSRRPSDTRRRMSRVARNAFFNTRASGIQELNGKEFWAVKDVSFSLKRGQAIGVIGLNGSGKTTLLRMLAGQIMPDAGEVTIYGSFATMIDLTAGFQASASGRENIFLRSAALGFSRAEATAHLQEIIDFSEIEHAIDAPLTTYSSGMKMRLAFSIMAMVAPDVLLIDEVLAVGDFRFRQKSLTRMREMRARSAFVFVSHSMGDVARFCDHVIVMHKGSIAFSGKPDDAIAYYLTLEQDNIVVPNEKKSLIPEVVSRPDLISDFHFEWLDHSGSDQAEFMEGKPLRLRVSFALGYTPRNLVVGVPIYTNEGDVLTGLATDARGELIQAEKGQRISIEMYAEDILLVPGQYRSAIGIVDGTEFIFMEELPEILVRNNSRKSWGNFSMPFTWQLTVDGSAVSRDEKNTPSGASDKKRDI